MVGSDDDRGKSMKLGAEDRRSSGISQVLGGRTIGRLGDIMCDPHHTRGGDEKHRFPSFRWRRFVSGLASKPLRQFLGLGLKTKVNGLIILTSKSS
jgi:hypothetical protein